MTRLLTKEEAAELLRCSVRKLVKLPIPVVRVQGSRRYDQKDISDYVKACKQCPSTIAPTARTSGRRSRSGAVGFAEALASHPVETQSSLSDNSETSFASPPRPRSSGRRSQRPRSTSIRLVANTGSTTDAD